MYKNDFALTPPMGWNSFDYYDAAVTEADIKKNADYMAAHLKQHGYEYIVVDIAWYAHNSGADREHFEYIPFDTVEIDEYSRLLPDPRRFPSSQGGKGFKPLADYVHSLGLKFGIHIMRGIPRIAAAEHMKVMNTDMRADQIANPFSICMWNSDMYGVRDNEGGQSYYDSVFRQYADWGVDFVKCDDICDSRISHEGENSTWHEIRMIHEAIMKTGRPIVLSLSPGAALIDKSWVYGKYANMWRMTDDFWDKYELLKPMFRRCEMWQDHVKKGCFPDCDMLPLGHIGKHFNEDRETRFTYDESKMMMTLWCMFRAPRLMGCELTMLDEKTTALLTTDELLACLRETAKGTQIYRDADKACWTNVDEATGEIRVALFNLSDEDKVLSVTAHECNCGLAGDDELTELWTGEETAFADGVLTAEVPHHGVRVYKVSTWKTSLQE